MILQTAITHFNKDIERSKQLLNHAATLPNGTVKDDILRASWMMAVGSLDAYFCDAYGDLVARTFRAKRREPAITLPVSLNNVHVPILVVLDNDLNNGWLWRMIARDLIEKDNVLSINKITELFNVFARDSRKLFNANGHLLDEWIQLQQSRHRLFGFYRTEYRSATANIKHQMRKKAVKHMKERFVSIFQRRHDCIHNCDRPKTAINRSQITFAYAGKVIDDIEFIVNRCHTEFLTEFPYFIRNLGFNSVTRNSIGV